MDVPASLLRVAAALAGPRQPQDALAALDEALREHPGHKLFTVLWVDEEHGVSRRIYTSNPVSYPCGGTKPLRRGTEFHDKVVVAGVPRICRTPEECRAAFPDFELIAQLGCGSALNYPVRFDGVTLGSLNLLHEGGWYGTQSLEAMGLLASLAIPVLLHTPFQSSETP